MLFGNTVYQLESILTRYDNLELALRIFIAAVMGVLVGIERSRRLKGAGVRTHCIIAMSAAVFMILSKYAFADLAAAESIGVKAADPARIAAQVVSGISFLGAGIIFKQGRNSIHGLTTAAGMWATAAIGMSVGAGMYWVAVTEFLLIILIQYVLHRPPFDYDILTSQTIEFRFSGSVDINQAYEELKDLLEDRVNILDSGSIHKEAGYSVLSITIRSRHPLTVEEVMQYTSEHPGISGVLLQNL